MKWTNIWHGPFKHDHYGYVWDKDNVMVFSVDDLTEENDRQMQEFCADLVAVLNGEEPSRRYSNLVVRDGCDVYHRGLLVGSFRGWGHLTGGLKLSTYEAAEVQDELIVHALHGMAEDGVFVIELQKEKEKKDPNQGCY